ncbi:alpha/beta-hydrolase [Roridomyces roridus]|uniref:carboxypeptidase C n=1 Tax=Roridomyces roridus TaxID=1738132 RepID=A0AAD7FG97_9AGAR|nr:alpha/beta-hydrolase [Roridomyces roridus]
MSSKSELLALPVSSRRRPPQSTFAGITVVLLSSLVIVSWLRSFYPPIAIQSPRSFYHRVHKPEGICGNSSAVSYAGHIGLHGDTEESPKRSFFWYFEAEESPEDAPIILTIGGGPGTSGMMNALQGQSPCSATEHGLAANPYTWTKRHNLIALDHPIGVGFSYGTHVNNSRSAAYDAYDFLQKFFVLFPHLARNKFIISGGSYGGVYVPNIATVIHEQNLLLKAGRGQPGAIPINLDALIISNPFTSPASHFRWLLQYRCMDHHIHNETECTQLYSALPTCLDSIELALAVPSVPNRVNATHLCYGGIHADFHGIVPEDIRRTCVPEDKNDPVACHPRFRWFSEIFSDPTVRNELGVPENLNFTGLNMEVNQEFQAAGDMIQAHHLLYPPLLSAGIRLLHYIGKQDANCPWLGTLSFVRLKLLETPFQQAFLEAPDVPWPPNSRDVGTVRAVGPGAGNFTLILLEEAGHFTVADQPALAQRIVETWIANEAWF